MIKSFPKIVVNKIKSLEIQWVLISIKKYITIKTITINNNIKNNHHRYKHIKESYNDSNKYN